MTTRIGVGFSEHRNVQKAGQEAVASAMAQAGIEGRPDFVFVFAAVGYDQQAIVAAVRAATSSAPLVGCSAEGLITQGQAIEENFGVLVTVLQSDEMQFTNMRERGLKEDPEGVGRRLGDALKPVVGPDARALFLFTDGLAFNFDRFSAGLWGTLEPARFLPMVGAMAGENFKFDQTYQYFDDEVFSGGLSCALLSGQARLAYAVNHGSKHIGPEHIVTRCQGNVIQELDGKPAVEVMKQYLLDEEQGDWTRAVVNLSLGLKAPDRLREHDEYTIRTILDMMRYIPGEDDATGAITLTTEITEGQAIYIMRRDAELIEEGVVKMAGLLRQQLGDHTPKLAFQFDCAGRGKMLFREQQKLEILEILQRELGKDVPWMGFYSYGEIGPLGENNCIHNFTAVTGAIY
jgi:hypothetical protein